MHEKQDWESTSSMLNHQQVGSTNGFGVFHLLNLSLF